MTHRTYRRRPTRIVLIGRIGVGGLNPIRIQSMTTSDTKDTVSVVREIHELVNAGCEIVRLTVPTQADCDNLPNIRREMASLGLKVPLVADIHFTPSVAMKVVDYVEKVRINPGNFADKKLFKTFEIADDDYQAELKRIGEKFSPLVLKCKERGVALRVGANHGSLSDRIMNRYGDTPLGMVESALEFLRIAAKLNYHDIVLSMKASNPQVMVRAYRLLVARMKAEGMDYPLHLGVTEAGEGEDARIKSALGIGTLLEEGIGDTVRVSLTEDSVHEIPVARAIVARIEEPLPRLSSLCATLPPDRREWSGTAFPLSYSRRPSLTQDTNGFTWGGSATVRVWSQWNDESVADLKALAGGDTPLEGVEFDLDDIAVTLTAEVRKAGLAVSVISNDAEKLQAVPAVHKRVFLTRSRRDFAALEKLIATCAVDGAYLELCLTSDLTAALPQVAELMRRMKFSRYGFSLEANATLADYRHLVGQLDSANIPQPVHLRYQAGERPILLDAPVQIGALLVDGIGDSIQIDGPQSLNERTTLAYGILQATRVRISKTEFIACPSCGRTQFNLQDVTARIKARTAHLKGLKIAVMGCIVNGPGEMADADFGYVGTGTGKISLYVGKECVERNIPETGALDNLVTLIKDHGKWVEPRAPIVFC